MNLKRKIETNKHANKLKGEYVEMREKFILGDQDITSRQLFQTTLSYYINYPIDYFKTFINGLKR